MTQPRELVALAEAAVDQVEELFRSGLGAPPAHFKGEGDFATEVDLQIEQQLRLHLTQLTGIEVYMRNPRASAVMMRQSLVPPCGSSTPSTVRPTTRGQSAVRHLVSLIHEARLSWRSRTSAAGAPTRGGRRQHAAAPIGGWPCYRLRRGPRPRRLLLALAHGHLPRDPRDRPAPAHDRICGRGLRVCGPLSV